MSQYKVLGAFICPHKDGDYECTVTDLGGWATGYASIVQIGQHERHTLVVNKDEAAQLAAILMDFARN